MARFAPAPLAIHFAHRTLTLRLLLSLVASLLILTYLLSR